MEPRNKLWASGAHLCPNTSKYLAVDTDLTFTTYSDWDSDQDSDNSDQEEFSQSMQDHPQGNAPKSS